MKVLFRWYLILALMALRVTDVQSLLMPAPMKCLANYERTKYCITPKMDDSNITDFALQEMVPEETEDLTIVCTSKEEGSNMSAKVFNRLTNLRRLTFWNCMFEHFPAESLRVLSNLTSLTFHSAAKYVTVHKFLLMRTLLRSLYSPIWPFVDIQDYSVDLLCSLSLLTDLSITGYKLVYINQTLPCSISTCCGHIVTLNFSANFIYFIQEDMFEGLENVKILDLTYNRIEFVPTNAFSKLKSLTKVVLRNNYLLKEISIQIFKLNLNLNEIDIVYGDQLDAKIVPNSMTMYNRDEELNFRGCTDFTDLDDEDLSFLTKVTSFSICFRNWTYSNENLIQNCRNLRYLSLKYYNEDVSKPWSQETKETPPFAELVLKELSNLTKFLLEVESMRLNPNMFENLTSLQHLTLQRVGQTSSITSEVFSGLRRLQFLKITCIPFPIVAPWMRNRWETDIMKQFSHLKAFYVEECDFSPSLEGASSLEQYGQNRNEWLRNVPLSLCNREDSLRLRTANLADNYIRNLRQGDFHKCRNLQLLDLSNNAISSFYDDTFANTSALTLKNTTSPFFPLDKLTDLVLHHNSITSFDFCLVPKSLRHLDLGFNRISVFTDTSKVGNSLQLKSLKLSGNRIQRFEPDIFPPTLRQISLGSEKHDPFNKKPPLVTINVELFRDLRNLEIFLVKHEKELELTSNIRPSKQGTYFHVEHWCEEKGINQLCPVYLPTLKSPIHSVINEFNIISYYDSSTLQHLYCKYFNKYTCIGDQCSTQKPLSGSDGNSVKVLDCSMTQFQTFPSMFPLDLLVEYLFLDGNNFSSIPSHSLATLRPTLKVVYLNNSGIAVINDYALHGHNGLQALHLENNYIENLPENMMTPSPLQFLYLQNNRIVRIGELRRYLHHSLQELHLESNLLTTPPPVLCADVDTPIAFDLSKEIYLQNNYLQSIDMTSLYSCKDLKVLILRNNSITSVENTINSRYNATPSSSGKTTSKLINLDLSMNSIKNVSSSFRFHLTDVFGGKALFQVTERQAASKGILVPILSISYLNLSNNDIEWIEPFTSDRMEQLQRLYLDGNLLTELHGEEFITITKTTYLEILSLSKNRLRSINHGTFRHMNALQVLDLSRNKMAALNATIFDRLTSLRQLFLDGNKLEVLHTEFDHLLQLLELRLNDNLLSSLNILTFRNLKQLKTLYLHNNKLISLEVWQLPTSLMNLTLLNNSLVCDCQFMPRFVKWMNSMRQDNSRNIQVEHCLHGEKQIAIQEFDNSLCRIPYEMILGVCLGVVVILFIALCILYYKRLEVQVWVYSRYGVRLFYKNEEQDKRFDVFIAYSSEDEEFVIDKLLPELKDYKICIHFKDFMPGSYITEAIAEAVENSCRTLLVFTPRFLESPWCKYEFKMAHNKSLLDRCCRLILLLLEDVDEANMDQEQKAYLRTNTYIKWDDKLFWEKLKFALPNVHGDAPQPEQLVELEGWNETDFVAPNENEK